MARNLRRFLYRLVFLLCQSVQRSRMMVQNKDTLLCIIFAPVHHLFTSTNLQKEKKTRKFHSSLTCKHYRNWRKFLLYHFKFLMRTWMQHYCHGNHYLCLHDPQACCLPRLYESSVLSNFFKIIFSLSVNIIRLRMQLTLAWMHGGILLHLALRIKKRN